MFTGRRADIGSARGFAEARNAIDPPGGIDEDPLVAANINSPAHPHQQMTALCTIHGIVGRGLGFSLYIGFWRFLQHGGLWHIPKMFTPSPNLSAFEGERDKWNCVVIRESLATTKWGRG